MNTSLYTSSNSSSSSSSTGYIQPILDISTNSLDDGPTVQIVFGTLHIISTIFGALLMYWFYQRRNIQPIKARLPKLVMCSGFTTFLWFSYVSLARIFIRHFPCWLNTLAGHVLLFAGFDMYFLRIWVLFFAYNMTQEKLGSVSTSVTCTDKSREASTHGTMIPVKQLTRSPESQSHSLTSAKHEIHLSPESQSRSTAKLDPLVPKPDIEISRSMTPGLPHEEIEMEPLQLNPACHTWYISHKHLVSRKYLIIYFCIALTLQTITPAIIIAQSPHLWHSNLPDCIARSLSDNILYAYIVVHSIIFLYSGYRLRMVDDGFFIKKELRVSALLVLLGATVWFLLAFIPQNSSQFPGTQIFLMVLAVSVFYYSLLLPLYHSYATDHMTEKQMHDKYSIESINSLEKLLNHKFGAAAFKIFMVKEFAVENFLFYRATQEFYQKYMKEDMDLNPDQQPPSPQVHPLPSPSTPPSASPRELIIIDPKDCDPSPTETTPSHESISHLSLQRTTVEGEIIPIHPPVSPSVRTVTNELTVPNDLRLPMSKRDSLQSNDERIKRSLSTVTVPLKPKGKNILPKQKIQARYEHARQICEQFISPESVMQVNLPAETVRGICATLDLTIPASPVILSPAISPRTAEERHSSIRHSTIAVNPTPAEMTAVTPTPISASPISGSPLTGARTLTHRPTVKSEPHLVPHTLFKSAHEAIFKLMLNDSYKRFLMSAEYDDLILELERRGNETVILQDIQIL